MSDQTRTPSPEGDGDAEGHVMWSDRNVKQDVDEVSDQQQPDQPSDDDDAGGDRTS